MAVQLVTDGETAADSGHLVLSVTGLEAAYGGSAPALRQIAELGLLACALPELSPILAGEDRKSVV